ncbi:MAG: 1-acyl-sn-glycerol-3-phosphate acyltransferase, partial [Proteobacteria bacterium]
MTFRVLRKLCCLTVIFLCMFIALPSLRSIERKQKLYRFFLRGMCRTLNLRVHFEGEYRGRDPRLIIANHLSYLDIIVIGSLFPTAFLAKREIAAWPIAGWLAKITRSEFVVRDSVPDRVKTLKRLRLSLATTTYCIFPEGTTTSFPSPLLKNWHRGHGWLSQASN